MFRALILLLSFVCTSHGATSPFVIFTTTPMTFASTPSINGDILPAKLLQGLFVFLVQLFMNLILLYSFFPDAYLKPTLSQSSNVLLIEVLDLKFSDLSKPKLAGFSETLDSFLAHNPSAVIPFSDVFDKESFFQSEGFNVDDKDLSCSSLPTVFKVELRVGDLSEDKLRSLIEAVAKCNPHFTVVLTNGLNGSVVANRHKRQNGEETSSVDAKQPIFVNFSNCFYVYADSITFNITKKGSKPVMINFEGGKQMASAECNETQEFVATYPKLEKNGTVSVQLLFNVTYDKPFNMWQMQYGVQIDGNETTEWIGQMLPYTPAGFGYRCSPQTIIIGKQSDTEVMMMMSGVQLQPWNLKDEKFNTRCNDCVGFFTGPIWAGLVSFAFLIVIGWFGVYFLSNIIVMDRFEDAKDPNPFRTTTQE